MTVGITNEARSSLAKLAERVFLVRAGRESSVAATKTYTGQIMLLYLLAYALGGDLKIDDLRRIPDFASQALKLEDEMPNLAGRYRFMDHAVVVGRGLNYSNAFEFALKLMETCYVVAERFSSADFLHGPIALVEANFPMFVFAPSGVTWPGMKDTIAKLQLLRAETVVITDEANKSVDASRVIRIAVETPGAPDPDPLHCARPTLRRLPRLRKGPRPRQAAHAKQNHPHPVNLSQPCGATRRLPWVGHRFPWPARLRSRRLGFIAPRTILVTSSFLFFRSATLN